MQHRPGSWMSRPTFRTSGRSATSPAPSMKESTKLGTPARDRDRIWQRHSPSASAPPRLVFRADISRPQWQRDSLDGLLDYLVVSNCDADLSPSCLRAQAGVGRNRRRIRLEQPHRGLERSTGGVVPGRLVAGCRRRPALADRGNSGFVGAGGRAVLVLPGPRPCASGSAPIPSIRLKAYRRGQQDVEYLALWSSLHKEPRWAVGAQVRAALKLAGTRHGTGFAGGEDAGRIDFDRLRPGQLWALRVALGEALSQAHPPPGRKLIEWRTPRRDPGHLPRASVGE